MCACAGHCTHSSCAAADARVAAKPGGHTHALPLNTAPCASQRHVPPPPADSGIGHHWESTGHGTQAAALPAAVFTVPGAHNAHASGTSSAGGSLTEWLLTPLVGALVALPFVLAVPLPATVLLVLVVGVPVVFVLEPPVVVVLLAAVELPAVPALVELDAEELLVALVWLWLSVLLPALLLVLLVPVLLVPVPVEEPAAASLLVLDAEEPPDSDE